MSTELQDRKARRREEVVAYDEFLEAQLQRARGQVLWVDLASHGLTLVCLVLGYWLVFAVADHWLIPGGWGAFGRWVALIGLAVLVAGFGVWKLLPLILRRVNPLYAAQVIEQSQPSLKNSLLNLLLLRRSEAPPGKQVIELIEQRAATAIAEAPVESVVDRSPVIRVGYALMAIVAALCVYKLASPKDPLRSMGRLLMPWSQLAPPSRVVIEDIEPGDAVAFYDDRLRVSAAIRGLREGEAADVVFSSADGQIVDQTVALNPRGGRMEAQLPEGAAGLRQSLEYHVVAGDARSPTYQVEVVSSPTILVERVEYDYPDYTGLATASVARQGDLKALEGTEVTIHATANRPIREAYLEFDTQGARLPMQLRGSQETATAFKLQMNSDRSGPEHAGYQLRFKGHDDQGNRRLIHHQIEVTPDEPPTVEIAKPGKDGLSIPSNGKLRVEVKAEDPDFGLRSVKLLVTRNGQKVHEATLVEKHSGAFTGGGVIAPADLGLRPGDEIVYWAEARDIKLPLANSAETIRYKAKIADPADKPQEPPSEEKESQQADDTPGESQEGQEESESGQSPEPPSDPKEQGDEQPPREESSGEKQGEEGESGEGEAGQRESGEGESGEGGGPSGEKSDSQKSDEGGEGQSGAGDSKSQGGSEASGADGGRVDPETQAGDAIERILKDRQEQQDSSGGATQSKQDPSQQPSNESKAPGSPQSQPGSDGSESAKPQQGKGDSAKPDSPQPGDKPDPAQKASDEPGSDKPMGDQEKQEKPGEQQGEQQTPSGEKQSGEKQAGEKQSGEKQPGEKSAAPQAGEPGQGQPQAGEGQEPADSPMNGQPQSGQQPDGESKQPPSGQGDSQSGQKPSAEGQTGDQQGEKQPGDKQAGDQQGESGQSGAPNTDPKSGEKSPSSESSGQGQSSGAPKESQPQDSSAAQKQSGSKSGEAGGEKSGDKNPSDKTPSEKGASPEAQPGQSPNGEQKQPPGDGGQSPPSDPKEASDGQQQPSEEGGSGAPQQTSGEPGAGQKAEDNRATPDGQKQQRDASQSRRPESGEQQSEPTDPASSPSQSERKSDSEGGQQGDQSGGGQSGGGQRADKPGQGSSGDNSQAEQGQGAAQQKGDGQSSGRPGEQQASEQGSDSQGAKQQGQGGQQGDKGQPQSGGQQSSGNQPPGGDSSQGAGNPSGTSQTAAPPSSNPGASSASGAPSGSSGHGMPGADGARDGNVAPPPPENQAAKPSDPNLDYARQATDLALEHLRDQLNKPGDDQELLDKLGWTRDEAEAFLRRWDKMKQDAAGKTPEAEGKRQELDERLKRLGLRPRATREAAAAKAGDQQRNLREGRRSDPPLEYLDQFRAFSEGTAKAPRK